MQRIDEVKLTKALSWFADKIKSAYEDPRPKSAEERKKNMDIYDIQDATKKMLFFHLYTHIYANPLWKEELPYYDAMPLYFPVQMLGPAHGNGAKICALNIHYLTHTNRIIMIQEIYEIVEKSMERLGYNPDIEGYSALPQAMMTKLVGKHVNAVFLGLAGSAGTKKIRNAYRMYLLNRIGGKIKRIRFDEWENAANVILPQFRKQGEAAIMQDMNRLYDKYRNNNWQSLL